MDVVGGGVVEEVEDVFGFFYFFFGGFGVLFVEVVVGGDGVVEFVFCYVFWSDVNEIYLGRC